MEVKFPAYACDRRRVSGAFGLRLLTFNGFPLSLMVYLLARVFLRHGGVFWFHGGMAAFSPRLYHRCTCIPGAPFTRHRCATGVQTPTPYRWHSCGRISVTRGVEPPVACSVNYYTITHIALPGRVVYAAARFCCFTGRGLGTLWATFVNWNFLVFLTSVGAYLGFIMISMAFEDF